MNSIFEHLRNKLVAGVLAAVPIVIVVYVAVWVEKQTKVLAEPLGVNVPGLGVLIAVAGIYLLGVLVTSFLGRLFFGVANAILKRVPGLGIVYQAVRDSLVVPLDQAGMFSQTVLVDVGEGRTQLGFTSGRGLPSDPETICVFLPNIPNPFSGQLFLAPRAACTPLKMGMEEALKFQLSTGNYLPPSLVGSTTSLPRPIADVSGR